MSHAGKRRARTKYHRPRAMESRSATLPPAAKRLKLAWSAMPATRSYLSIVVVHVHVLFSAHGRCPPEDQGLTLNTLRNPALLSLTSNTYDITVNRVAQRSLRRHSARSRLREWCAWWCALRLGRTCVIAGTRWCDFMALRAHHMKRSRVCVRNPEGMTSRFMQGSWHDSMIS